MELLLESLNQNGLFLLIFLGSFLMTPKKM